MRKLILTLFPARPLLTALLIVALSAAAGIALGDENVTPAKAATKYTAFAGGGGAGVSVETFMPNVINVNQGDSVEFVNPYEQRHTVTFLADRTLPPFALPPQTVPGAASIPPRVNFNPLATNKAPATGAASYDGSTYANSGILEKGQSWTATFPKLGNYAFVCIIHPTMIGDVNVLAPGVWVPSQAQRDSEAASLLKADLAKGQASAAAARPGRATNANGTNSWDVVNPPVLDTANGPIVPMVFAPARLQIGVGDTVVWKNETTTPHTATFTSGASVPEFFLTEAQPSGPPILFQNLRVSLPVKPSQNYEGAGYFNSGVYSSATPRPPGGTSFSLTFTKAGTYPYVCVLHANQGMAGVVEFGGAGITPPSTGEAGLAATAGGASVWTPAGVILLLLAFGASVVAFRRSVHGRD